MLGSGQSCEPLALPPQPRFIELFEMLPLGGFRRWCGFAVLNLSVLSDNFATRLKKPGANQFSQSFLCRVLGAVISKSFCHSPCSPLKTPLFCELAPFSRGSSQSTHAAPTRISFSVRGIKRYRSRTLGFSGDRIPSPGNSLSYISFKRPLILRPPFFILERHQEKIRRIVVQHVQADRKNSRCVQTTPACCPWAMSTQSVSRLGSWRRVKPTP